MNFARMLFIGTLFLAACDQEAREQPLDLSPDTTAQDTAPSDTARPETSGTDTAVVEDTAPPNDTTAADIPEPPSDLPDAILVGHTGIDVPTALTLDASRTGRSLPLGPRLPSGYGLGEATLDFMLTLPDGTRVVVGIGTRDGRTHFFALDAQPNFLPNPPSEVLAVATQFRHEAMITPDSTTLVYGDGNALFAVPLDGAEPARLLARIDSPPAPAYPELDRLRWVPGSAPRIAFDFRKDARQSGSQVYTARLDGSDAASPVELTPDDGTQYHVQQGLTGSRVVLGHDGGLFVAPADGTAPAVRVTPELERVSGVAPAAGDRLVVELYTSVTQPRDIASVATDGSQAESPVRLATALSSVDFLVMPSGEVAVFKAREGAGYRVWRVPTDGSGSPQALGPALNGDVILYANTEDAVIACSGDALLRIDLSATATTPHNVLANSTDWGGQGCRVMGLTAGETRVVLQAQDAEGTWTYYEVPVDGTEEAVALPFSWHPEVTPVGVIWREPVALSFVSLMSRLQWRGAITSYLDGVIDEARVVQGGFPTVAFHVTGKSQGWYSTDPYLLEPRERLLSESVRGGRLKAVAGQRLVIEEDNRLVTLHVYGGPEQVVLDPLSPWTVDPERGVVFAVVESRIEAVPLDGTDTWTVATLPAPDVLGLVWVESTDEVVWVGGTGGEAEAYAASADGTGSGRLIASGMTDWPMHMLPVPGSGRVLITLGTPFTATPHPYRTATVSTDGSDAGGAPLLDETFGVPWALSGEAFVGFSLPSGPVTTHSVTADGAYLAMATEAGGVLSIAPEGGEAIRLTEPGLSVTALDPWIAPDNRTLLGLSEQIVALPIDGSAPMRLLSPPLASPWVQPNVRLNGEVLVVYAQLAGEETPWLMELPWDGSGANGPRILARPEAGVLEALSPNGDVVVYGCTEAKVGTGLCAVDRSVEPSVVWEAAPKTNDVVERFVDWLQVSP